MNLEDEFTYEIAKNFLNEVFKEKEKQYLNDAEEIVLKCSWNNLTYEAMTEYYNYSANYLKEIGKNLWIDSQKY